MSLLYSIPSGIPLWQYSFKRLKSGDIEIKNSVSKEIITLGREYTEFDYDSRKIYFNINGQAGDHIPWFHSLFEMTGNQYLLLSGMDTSVTRKAPFLNTSSTPLKVLSVKSGQLLDVTNVVFQDTPSTYWTRDLHVADINGDGFLDLFSSNHGREVGLVSEAPVPRVNPIWGEKNNLLLGSLNGWRENSNLLPEVVDFSHGSALADLNGDGSKEIIVNNLGAPDWFPGRYILKWNGKGFDYYSTTSLFLEERSDWILSGDLNLDGMDDVVIANKIFWGGENFGNNFYNLPITFNQKSGFINWQGGAVVDINGDALLDIIKVSASDGRESSGVGPWEGLKIDLFLNAGATFFDGSHLIDDFDMDKMGINITILDYNFDGRVDIMTSGPRYLYNLADAGVDRDNNYFLQQKEDGSFSLESLNLKYPSEYVYFLQHSDNVIYVVSLINNIPILEVRIRPGFDIRFDIVGNAGQVAKTLGAVFGASTVNNKEYVGIGLSLLDGGMTYEALMGLALRVKLGNALSHATVVNLLHTNVMGAAPTQAERDFYVGLLDSGVYNPMSLGVLAAETPLNATNINLVGLSQTGLEFLPV